RVLARDAFVHLEQVAVLLLDVGASEAGDRVGEVQVHAVAARPHAAALVAHPLRGPRRDVAWRQVAEAGIGAFEIVVALGLRVLARRPSVAGLLRYPDAAVFAQRLAHQRELRLVLPAHRDARGMDLREARVGDPGAPPVGAPDGGGVASLGVGG